jgi:hypothetical protein
MSDKNTTFINLVPTYNGNDLSFSGKIPYLALKDLQIKHNQAIKYCKT